MIYPLDKKERVRAELYNIASKFCKESDICTTNKGYWWTAKNYLEKATLLLTKNNPEVEVPPEQSGLEIMINFENTLEKNVSLQKIFRT